MSTKKQQPGRPRLSFAEKVRRAARPHETAGEVVGRLMKYGATLLDSARYLEERGYRTPRGRLRWSAAQAYFEWLKFRVAKGRGTPLARELADNDFAAFINAKSDAERIRLLEQERLRSLQSRAGINRVRTTYPLRDKTPSIKNKARAAWWLTSEAARLQGGPVSPEPQFDSRGRLLKGRRFSRLDPTKIKALRRRKIGPRKPA
jgi:hypothetical protein